MALGHVRVFTQARSDASSYAINGSTPLCYTNHCPPSRCHDNRLAVMSLESSTAQNYSNGGIGVTTETSVAAGYGSANKQSSFYYSPLLPGDQSHVATVTAASAPVDHYKHFKHGFYNPGVSGDAVTRMAANNIPTSPSRDTASAAQPTLVANGNEGTTDGARVTGKQNHSSIMGNQTQPPAESMHSPPMSAASISASPPSFYQQQMNLYSGIKQQQQQQQEMQLPQSAGHQSNEQTIPNGEFSSDRTEASGRPDPSFDNSQLPSTSPDNRMDSDNKPRLTTEPNESSPMAPSDAERKNSTNTDESSPRKPESSDPFSFDGAQPNLSDLRESGNVEGNANDSQNGSAVYRRYPSSEALTPPSGDDSEKAMGEMTGADSPTCQRVETHNGYELYYCHLCSYVGNSKYHFNAHMNAHFEHACPQCDYTSRTEGRLKRHIKDFHSDTPPNNFSGSRMLSSSPSSFAPMKREPGRPKLFRCRHCDFSSPTKVEFWDHARTHIKDDKILQCPKCPFVTEYKHHLEYHLRNHFGSKPFRCNKCNYACVNKSMLNSHMKSHTNVYQYRCADCTYATKYCHSLKLHLRKYNHHPATVLNADGSLPVDGSGDFELVSKRGPPRGPRGPRREGMSASKTSSSPPMQIASTAAAAAAAAMMLPQGRPGPSPNGGGGQSPLNSAMLGPASFWAMMGQHQHQQAAMAMTHNSNNLQMAPPPLIPITGITPLDIRLPHSVENSGMPPHQMVPSQRASPGYSGSSPPATSGTSPMQFHCNFCGFPAESRSTLTQHMLKVHAVENQDLFSMFGIHAESLADESAVSSAASGPLVAKSLSYKHDTSPPNVSEAWAAMMQSVSGSGGDRPAVMSMASSRGVLLPPPEGGIYAMSTMSCANPEMSFANQMLGTDSVPRVSPLFVQTPDTLSRPRQSGERPLDLTKRRSDGEEDEPPPRASPGVKRKVDVVEGNDDNSNMSTDLAMPTPARKRSRKGKAYKLDTLSLKMQDQYEDSPPDGDPEDDDISNQSAPNYPSPVNIYREKSVITDGKTPIPQPVFTMLQPDGSTFSGYQEPSPRGLVVDFLEGKQKMRENNMAPGMTDTLNMRPRSKSIGDIARYSCSPHLPPALGMDPSSAYSLGMSRRKLFMIQQMEQQISSEQNKPGETAPSPMATPTSTPMTMPAPTPAEEEKKNKSAPVLGRPENSSTDGKKEGSGSKHMYECSHCEIVFRNCVMYTMHMGYHGYHNPLKCNMCGYESKDQLDFFLHIARVAHE